MTAPTVQIPFVTSYEGYTQRIVIVNRNKVDVAYALTFRAEGDGMRSMGDNPHEGMATRPVRLRSSRSPTR